MNTKSNLSLGITCMVLASLAYTTTSIFVKLIGNTVPINVILFFRYSLFFILLLPIALKQKAYHIHKQQMPIFLLRGLCGLSSIGLFFYSIQFLSLGIATVLASSTPLFVPLILRITRKIKIIPQLYWGLTIGLMGVVVIIHPNIHHIQLAMLIALFSAVFRAGSSVSVRTLAKTYSPLTILFYYFLIGTLATGASLFFNFSVKLQLPWLYLGFVALFGAVYQLCLTTSLSLAPARLVTPFTYLTVVFAIIADWFIWQELPSLLTLLGIILVIIGVFLVVFLGRSAIEKS